MARTIDLGKVVGEGGGGLASDPREDESTESPELGSVPTNADQLGGMTYQQIVDLIYPIGRTITTLDDADNPNTLYPWQTWERTAKGRMLIGTGAPENNDDGTSPGDYNMLLGSKGGEEKHTLTIDEMAMHEHVGLYWSNNTSGSTEASHDDGTNCRQIKSTGGAGSNNQHYITGKTGGDQPHNNMSPYIAANIWKRVS